MFPPINMKMSQKIEKIFKFLHLGQLLSSTNPKQSIHLKGVLGDHYVVAILI
jgi:hypothetical protein